jgi:hypothetical protein
MTEIVEVLKKARGLISDPKHWTQGTFAKDAYGREVDPEDDQAICFCAIGAIHAAAGGMNEDCGRAIWDLRIRTPERSVSEFNDHRSHAEVLELFDDAIARLA